VTATPARGNLNTAWSYRAFEAPDLTDAFTALERRLASPDR